MKNITGNREAYELARKELGPRAYAKRIGKRFEIGRAVWSVGQYRIDHALGTGRSWESALKDAGIRIPEPGEEKLIAAITAANVNRVPFPDGMPEDTDAKVPLDMEG